MVVSPPCSSSDMAKRVVALAVLRSLERRGTPSLWTDNSREKMEMKDNNDCRWSSVFYKDFHSKSAGELAS